ncbi:MAG: ATP-binding protein [Acidimicrobiia bacterium]|nr:ATP-binding protein [Acidimicrobiia bacterium]
MQTLLILLALSTIVMASLLWRQQSRHARFRRRIQASLEAPTESETGLLNAAGALSRRAQMAQEDAERLEAALEVSHVGIVIVDEDGTEVFANQAATSYATGRAGDAVVGIRLRELLVEVADTGVPQEQQIEVFTPSQRTIRLRAMPLLIGDRPAGTIAFTDDLTPASRVDTIRRDFVANASHELKTPLGALRLLAEALVTTTDRDAQMSLSERIQSEATRMTRLVEDILDLSLIEEHQSVRGVVDLCDVVDDSLRQAQLASEALGVPIEVKCESVEVLGDHRRLVSAVANLLENAITYTSAKGAESIEPVSVRGFRDEQKAIIEVEDHGIGIAARHQTRIFERFYRVDKGRSRASGGTGLGLAIVRHVVQNHWGDVEVESVPGRGSTFRITLPARESESAERTDSRG